MPLSLYKSDESRQSEQVSGIDIFGFAIVAYTLENHSALSLSLSVSLQSELRIFGISVYGR
jgi:hypothetical protein